MLQAMYSGISAIQAHQTQMDTIGNNIANVSTTAYKASRVTFADQLSETLAGASAPQVNVGGTNENQIGLGVKIASIDTLMAQGGLQSTTRPTDMAIQGNGYFMLGDSTGVSYTRAGNFNLDNNGNLVTSGGSYVLGWQSNPTGTVDTTKQISAASKLSIPVGGLTAVQATTAAVFGNSLSADAAVGTPPVVDANGVITTPATGASYQRSLAVYDSLGAKHTVNLTFTRDATVGTSVPTTTVPPANAAASSWSWTVSSADPTASTSAVSGSGQIFFDSNGKEIPQTTNGTINLTPTNSASALVATPDFSGVSMIAGAASLAPTSQNGYAPGTLQSFSVGADGSISGIFNNGLTRTLGQIAMADFANPAGLEREGGNDFKVSINSGLPQVGTALSGSLGKLSTGYLEQSNVDLSTEFTSMIVSQRGFQANTKIVSTVDQMLNEVINMKQ